MLPDFRIPTLVTGIFLVAVAPWVVWRVGRLEGWALGLMAGMWGLSRMLICYAQPPADLETRLMVYTFIAAAASGFVAAAALGLRGAPRMRAASAIAVGGGGLLVWYLFDHDAFLQGSVAGLNLAFPALLASLAAAGLAALSRQELAWLGASLLALPAFRAIDIAFDLIMSPNWTGPVAKAETLMYVATVALLVAALIRLAGRAEARPARIVMGTGLTLGAAFLLFTRLLPSIPTLEIRYGLDGLMAAITAAGLLSPSLPWLRAPPPPVPAEGP